MSRLQTTLLYSARAIPGLFRTTRSKSVIKQSKEGYYLTLRQSQVTIWTDATNGQAARSLFPPRTAAADRAPAEKVEREKIVLAVLPERSVRIIEFAPEHRSVTTSDIVRLTGTNRNTLKHFRKLVAQGRLVLYGRWRSAWYASS